ncbi:MAG TPA: hypothetical protein VGL69_06345 [Solirubrobacteraceae bacterium]
MKAFTSGRLESDRQDVFGDGRSAERRNGMATVRHASSLEYASPMPNAQIAIYREPRGFTDRLRSYKILIDGDQVGSIKRGGTVAIEVEAGRHTVQLAIDWARSQTLVVDTVPREEVNVRCWSNANPFLILYWATLGSQRYIGLERTGSREGAVGTS